MPTRYEIYLCRDTGERLLLLSEYFELQYQIVQQEAGFCHIVVPGNFDPSYIRPDNKISIWRQPESGTLALEDVYLIRYYKRYTDAEGRRRFEVIGANGNSILVDRMPLMQNTYNKYNCGARMTDNADDMIKGITRDAAYMPASTYFSIEADTAQGQSFTKVVKHRSIADQASAYGETSKGRGTDILWHVMALSETEYQLRTYVNQIGQNRTWPDGYNPILVSEESGTMVEPIYVWNGIEARNKIYALRAEAPGDDDPGYRLYNVAYDRLMGADNKTSIYSNRETIIDSGTDATTDEAKDEALEELDNLMPKETFTFKLRDTETQRYGRDWRFGDKITAFYTERYYTCRIRGVTVEKKNADTPESISIDMDIIPATAPVTS